MDELIKALTVLAKAATAYLERVNGEQELPLKVTDYRGAPAPLEQKHGIMHALEEKKQRGRPKKVEAAVAEPASSQPAIVALAQSRVQPPGDNNAEVKKRCRELLSAFIFKHQKDSPSGYEQVKTIVEKELGMVKKFEEMTVMEYQKLIPVFEKEMATNGVH